MPDDLVVVSAGGGPRVAKWIQCCIRSVAHQTVRCRHVVHLQDSPGAAREAERVAQELGHPVEVVHDEHRRYSRDEVCQDMMGRFTPSTIVALVDADDWLTRPDALEIVLRAYQGHDCWLTFGQFLQWPEPGIWPGWACADFSEDEVRESRYRELTWRSSHLRTFRVGLFRRIRQSDYWSNGRQVRPTDQVETLAMLEMAGGRYRFVPEVIYTYNCANSTERNAPAVVAQDAADLEFVRSLPKYETLTERPW